MDSTRKACIGRESERKRETKGKRREKKKGDKEKQRGKEKIIKREQSCRSEIGIFSYSSPQNVIAVIC